MQFAPSAQAVMIWRRAFVRTSPAANTPSADVLPSSPAMSRQKKGDVEFSDDYSKIEIPTSLKNDALKNIFEAAGRQPNTIPVEILELKAHKQSHGHRGNRPRD